MLTALYRSGASLHIATSKRQDIARTVVKHFGFHPFFKSVLGSGGLHTRKSHLLKQIQHPHPQPLDIMVGDRSFDMEAAKTCRFASIGVLWGYGSREELLAHGAQTLAQKMSDIPEIIQNIITSQ